MATSNEILDKVNKNILLVPMLKALGFEGVDVNLSISLIEYGIAWIKCDDGFVFIYGVSNNDDSGEYETFDTAFKNPSEFDSDYSWIDDGYAALESYSGDFHSLDFPEKIDTIRNFYGHLNAFGESFDRIRIFDSKPIRGEAFLASKNNEDETVLFEPTPGNTTHTLIGFDDQLSEGVTAEIFAIIHGDFAYFWSEVDE